MKSLITEKSFWDTFKLLDKVGYVLKLTRYVFNNDQKSLYKPGGFPRILDLI